MTLARKQELFEAKTETSDFPQKMRDLVLSAQKGDNYYFEDIYVVGPDNIRRRIQDIMFRVK